MVYIICFCINFQSIILWFQIYFNFIIQSHLPCNLDGVLDLPSCHRHNHSSFHYSICHFLSCSRRRHVLYELTFGWPLQPNHHYIRMLDSFFRQHSSPNKRQELGFQEKILHFKLAKLFFVFLFRRIEISFLLLFQLSHFCSILTVRSSYGAFRLRVGCIMNAFYDLQCSVGSVCWSILTSTICFTCFFLLLLTIFGQCVDRPGKQSECVCVWQDIHNLTMTNYA